MYKHILESSQCVNVPREAKTGEHKGSIYLGTIRRL